MMKYLFAFCLIAGLSFTSQAQRFCYIDSEYILNAIPDYEKAQETLDALSSDWQTEIENKMAEIDEMYRQFQQDQVLMTETMKQQKVQEIESKEQDLMAYQQEKFGPEGELFQKRQELIRPLQDKIYEEVQKLANSKGYDIIFDRATGTTMLFADEKYDKSEDILKALGY